MMTRTPRSPHSALAMPGLVFGSYPEQRQRKAPSLFARWLAPLASGTPADATDFLPSVRTLQARFADESATQFNQRLPHLRAQLARDGFSADNVSEAFALITLCCQRTLGIALYDTQLTAARILLDGHLAEMATGEGKTLAAAVAAATAALAGIPVHVITANDYLVNRDADALRALYAALGLTVGALTQPLPQTERQAAYACDITYCTAKELVFDYLRDSIAAPPRSAIEQRAAALASTPAPQRLLRGLCMAIIDEADSILIDEARVPLVLSRAAPNTAQGGLAHAWKLSAMLDPAIHFQSDITSLSTRLTAAGRTQVQALLHSLQLNAHAHIQPYAWLNARHAEDQITLALTARHLLQRERDYVVEDAHVHIVDATTGRRAEGRTWCNGLHQLVELKEGCTPTARVETLTQITYQRFFPRYFRLCGMSGTLREARRELHAVYGLRVMHVPLQWPARRTVLPAQVFVNAAAQWAGVLTCVQTLHALGRPVLVGTDSVRDSATLSRHLNTCGLPHNVLNAQQDRHEAAVVAAAGASGAITVATNMAGRGTDITLATASREAGGLHVICCQQNAARRIDRQLLGRCARHGDPGSAQVFINLQGPLLTHRLIAKILKKSFKNNMLYNTALSRYIATLAVIQLRQAQRAAERGHEIERAALLRQDQQVGDWFAFSGPEQ